MRLGLSSPPSPPINLAGGDSEEEEEEEDPEPPRKRALLPNARGDGAEATARGESRFRTPSPVRIARRKQRGLQFFMNPDRLRRALREEDADVDAGVDADAARVCAARALICGRRFGRCEARFGADRLGLRLWAPAGGACVWDGAVLYSQLSRCCLSSGERPPFLLLVEMEASATHYSSFARFFDPLLARWSQDHADTSEPQLYGAVLVLDEELAYARCRSIGDSIAALRGLFQQSVSPDEVQRFVALDRREAARSAAAGQERPPRDVQQTRPLDAGAGGSVSRDESSASEGKHEPAVIVLPTNESPAVAAADPRDRVALLYPFDDSEPLGRVSVTFGDIERLSPGEFLNDNLIDFYLRFVWRHCEPWQQRLMYFFSSHFFSQLKAPRDQQLSARERHARVARWTQKETDLFDKRFLFIPINDSFHWSIAVFCNPGSAIVTKRRRRRARRQIPSDEVIDVEADPFRFFRPARAESASPPATGFSTRTSDGAEAAEYVEEELDESRQRRREYPPCVLFLDSLRCHQKKRFSAMLREYLECEWSARNPPTSGAESGGNGGAGSDGTVDQPATVDEDEDADAETVVASFDIDSIGLVEPDVPRQSNSSDCGAFLLMYAVEVVRHFPAGATREDLETNLSTALTPDMFGTEHVCEFRDYVHQLIFCLRALKRRGLSEAHVRCEGLEWFTVDE